MRVPAEHERALRAGTHAPISRGCRGANTLAPALPATSCACLGGSRPRTSGSSRPAHPSQLAPLPRREAARQRRQLGG
eukprot:5146400-Alexandrium_andersonii.AAC.1